MGNWRVLFSEPNGVEHVAEIDTKSVYAERQVRQNKKTSQSPTPLQNIGRELAGLRGSDGGAVGAKSVHQGYQVGAILIGYGRKFQAQAAVGKLMLHDSFGTNLSLGN